MEYEKFIEISNWPEGITEEQKQYFIAYVNNPSAKMRILENWNKIIKEQHLWSSDLKIKHCGYGEWVEEPDHVSIQYRGYDAYVNRIFICEHHNKEESWFGGHLCGYVRIPEDHPYFGKKCDQMDIDTHGGLTFSKIDEEHWISFDCGHSCDYIPTMEYIRKTNHELKYFLPLPKGFENFCLNHVYRNIQYCINECIKTINTLSNIKLIDTLSNIKF